MHVVKGDVRAVCAVRTRKIHSYINTYGGGTYADTALKTAMRTDVKKCGKMKRRLYAPSLLFRFTLCLFFLFTCRFFRKTGMRTQVAMRGSGYYVAELIES